jgi:hypothetical protein
MPNKFDPSGDRKFWLDMKLAVATNFVPHEIGRLGQTLYLSGNLDSFIQAYLVGLADRVRPTLEKMIHWMETHPEDEPRQHSKDFGHWRAGWTDLYMRRETLGLCKWLSRGDPAVQDFAGALEAEWYSWTAVSPSDAALERDELEYNMPQYLAVALAAKNPVLGLKFLATGDMREPFEEHVPMIEFGEWACRHLALGGERNAEFIARGAEMLHAAPSDFFTSVRRNEAALWLKAIYWDTGVVRTPEQTIAKAYDFMPGVERPDFVAT